MESVLTADDVAPGPSTQTRWVVFLCAEERFGFPLAMVREIVPPRPFTRLPGAVRGVCGLIGLRGRPVTVIDAGVVLDMRPSVLAPDHRLLLLELGGRGVAVAVESVGAIAPARLETQEGALSGRFAAAVLGTGRVDEAAFVALDPSVLIAYLLN
jgi:purine-binding chemotaxis protein CheW